MMKHSTAFKSERGCTPPWKSSIVLCPVTLAQPFSSCQGFITLRLHTVPHSMDGAFMCCVVHMLTFVGQADVSAQNDCNAHWRVKYTLCVYCSVFHSSKHGPPLQFVSNLHPVCVWLSCWALASVCIFHAAAVEEFIHWLQDRDPPPCTPPYFDELPMNENK